MLEASQKSVPDECPRGGTTPETSPSWHEQITIGTGRRQYEQSGEAGAVCFRRRESREAYRAPEPKTKPLTAVAIALVDVRILDFATARTPGVDEEFASEAQEGCAEQGGPAVAQINGLPMPEIARGAGVHPEAQGHVRERGGCDCP